MRTGRFLALALFGLSVVAVFCRSGESADGGDEAAAKKQPSSTAAAPQRPADGFDLNQLPIGKTFGVEPTDARIMKVLEEPAEFSLTDVQLGDFVKAIEDKHKVVIKLDVAALTADGKGTETILNGKTRNTTLRAALRLFLDEHGLTVAVKNETLMITTKTAAETFTTTLIYQVHDLVLQANNPSARPDFENLMELIMSTIQPESWREAGGTQGEIRGYEGPGIVTLVIHQTDEAHSQIEKLLTDLRAAKVPALLDIQKKRIVPPAPAASPTGTRPIIGTGSGLGGGFF